MIANCFGFFYTKCSLPSERCGRAVCKPFILIRTFLNITVTKVNCYETDRFVFLNCIPMKICDDSSSRWIWCTQTWINIYEPWLMKVFDRGHKINDGNCLHDQKLLDWRHWLLIEASWKIHVHYFEIRTPPLQFAIRLKAWMISLLLLSKLKKCNNRLSWLFIWSYRNTSY